MNRIYLDNNATTALDPRVFKAMLVDLQGPPANPSSVHWFGTQAKNHLQQARSSIASFFQAKPEEITFTSGGTESANLFLRGLGTKGHVISTKIEHSCVLKTLQALEKEGLKVTYLPVGPWGAPLSEDLKAAIRSDTIAIALSAANNETGVRLDLETFADIAHQHHIPLFIDAVSFIGKEPFPMHPGITAVTLSGHKFHAPKGVGALFLRSSLKLKAQMTGGEQEYQHRAGTENLAGILGLAKALEIVQKDQIQISQHLNDLRLHLEHGLQKEIPIVLINGEGPRISNTSNLCFPDIDGETLLIQLDMAGIAVSHGSACASGALEPSRVLIQMGIPQKMARSSLRFSLSRMNTREEIDLVIEKTSQIVQKLSKMK
ncbi:MAG TPA: cysteine desulfurase family protein [Chlamydiales bacterium]|nr:cysteine desulfurase family protein [Chlamydiales bacterium]